MSPALRGQVQAFLDFVHAGRDAAGVTNVIPDEHKRFVLLGCKTKSLGLCFGFCSGAVHIVLMQPPLAGVNSHLEKNVDATYRAVQFPFA
jgi:hypothetical protein